MQKKILITLIIGFMLCMGSQVFAQTGLGFYGAGGGAALEFPEAGIGTSLGFWGRVYLGSLFMENLFFGGDVSYWSNGEDELYYEYKWSVFQIMAIAMYYFSEMNAQLRFYAGAGLGLAMSKVSVDYTGPSYPFKNNPMSPMAVQAFGSSYSETDLGLRGFGGLEYWFSDKVAGVAEVTADLGGIDSFGIRGGVKIGF